MALYDSLQADAKSVVSFLAGMIANYTDDSGASDNVVTFDQAQAILGAPLLDGQLDINVLSATEADGTALADFSDGASTTPGYDLTGSEFAGIRWNNHATPDPIALRFLVPQDMDTSQASTLYFLAAKTGATVGDAVTWEVTAFCATDGALYDADEDFGGTSSAMTGNATAKTVQLESLTLAADTMTRGGLVSLTVQPTDGTLGTDDVILGAVYLSYKKRVSG